MEGLRVPDSPFWVRRAAWNAAAAPANDWLGRCCHQDDPSGLEQAKEYAVPCSISEARCEPAQINLRSETSRSPEVPAGRRQPDRCTHACEVGTCPRAHPRGLGGHSRAREAYAVPGTSGMGTCQP